MKIVVDTNEATQAAKVAIGLRNKGFQVVVEKLFVGDYHVLGPMGKKGYIIERKTTTDLVHSLKYKYLWDQLRRLTYVTNAEPLLLLESTFAKIKRFTGFSAESATGILMSIWFDWHVPVILSYNIKTTVYAILNRARQLTKGKRVTYYPLRYVPKAMSKNEEARSVVEGFPMISAVRAVNLLKYRGSIVNIVNASSDDLTRIPGIGYKIARKITEVSNYQYKKEEQ